MAKATKGHQPATEKQPAGGASRYDWTALRTRFVTGNDSITEFADREGINRTTVAKRSSAEGWVDAREKHRERVASKATNEIAKRQVLSEAEIDGRAHDVAVKLFAKLETMVDAVADAQEAKALAQGLAETHRMARVTAHLTPEPVAAPGDASSDGVIRIKRRTASGDVIEVDLGGPAPHRAGPDGPDANADAGKVPE